MVGAAWLLLGASVLFGWIVPPVVWVRHKPKHTASGFTLSGNLRAVLWLLGALEYGARDNLLYNAHFSVTFLGASSRRSLSQTPWSPEVGCGCCPSLSITAMGKSTRKTHQEREGWSYQYGLRQASLNSANGILPPGTFWSGRQAHIRGWGKLAPAPSPPFLSLNMAGQPVPGGHRRKLLLYRVLAPLPLSS